MLWIVLIFSVINAFVKGSDAFHDWNRCLYERSIGYHVVYDSSPLIVCLVSLGVAILCFFIIAFFLSQEKTHEDEVIIKDLVSIRTNSRISGKGSGSLLCYTMSLEEKNVYAYFCKMNDGSFHRETVNADHTYIFEQKDCNRPRIEIHNTRTTYVYPLLTALLVFATDDNSDHCSYRYNLYVPENTVVRGFNLD